MKTALINGLPFLALLGALLVIVILLLAYFWPEVEWYLLCWLQRRRANREKRYQAKPRVAFRRPR